MDQSGQFKHVDIRSNSLCSTIYVKFDDPKAGNYKRQKTSEWIK